MRNRIFIILISFLLTNFCFAQKKICLVKDSAEDKINVTLNEKGIITSIEGKLGELSMAPIKIIINNDVIHIDSDWSLFENCFEVFLQKEKDFLHCDVLNHKSKEIYKNALYFMNGMTYDNYVKIQSTETGYKSSFSNKSYSLLPLIENENGTIYEHTANMDNRNFKFTYDNKKVDFFQIRPGDLWQKFMTAEFTDIKSEDEIVNLINYIIIYCYNDILGTMMFPVLMDLQQSSQYLDCIYSADSFFTEGSVKYIPENLMTTEISMPWVEGKEGDGIGSRIIIETKDETEISEIEFSNGFVSSKKQTYLNNNRVKTIRISDGKKQKMTVEIPDSSEPYEIKLDFKSKKIVIEILEVYKGEKYQDTCINYILCK